MTQDDQNRSYLDTIESRVLSHRGLRHPIFRHIRIHKLEEHEQRTIFLEFYFFIRHLPNYIAGLAANTFDERLFRAIIANLFEEVGENKKKSHLTLYREFLRLLHISNEEIHDYQCLESTTALDLGVKQLYLNEPGCTALGAIYAIESMSGEMVEGLHEGLRSQGHGQKTCYFFLLHMVSEQGHADEIKNIAGKFLLNDDNRMDFERGVFQVMELLENFWDGVYGRCASASNEEKPCS